MTGNTSRGLWATSAIVGMLALSGLAQTTDSGTPSTRPSYGDTPSTRPSGSGGQAAQDQTDQQRSDQSQGDRSAREPRLDQAERGAIRGGPISARDWVRVGYDFDDDGRFDSFDYVRQEDLDRLRTSSGNAMRGGEGMRGEQGRWSDRGRWTDDRQSRNLGSDRDGDFNRGRSDEFTDRGRDFDLRGDQATGARSGRRIEGRVLGTSRRDFDGRSHLIARIETSDQGTVQVDLGPADRASDQLDFIREGGRLTLFAHQGHSRDASLLVASRIEHDGRTITLRSGFEERNFSRRLGGNRFSGELQSTRIANFIGHDHDHLLARVRLDDGWTPLVDLGPAQDVHHLNLRAGDRLSFVARDGCINGSMALIADELRTPQGRFVQLDNYEADMPLSLRGRPTSGEYGSSQHSQFGRDSDSYYRGQSQWQERSDRMDESRYNTSGIRNRDSSDQGNLRGRPIGPESTDRDNSATGLDPRTGADPNRQWNRQPEQDDSTAPVPETPAQEDDAMDDDADDNADDNDAADDNDNAEVNDDADNNTSDDTSDND